MTRSLTRSLSLPVTRSGHAPRRRAAGALLLALSTTGLVASAEPGSGATAGAATRAPTCDDLNWSALVLAANPDIRESCLGVYVLGDTYYARSRIELVRIRGNALTFRPQHRDGSFGKARRITVPPDWRVTVGGHRYGPRDLSPGQQLDVFLPEDRFALGVPGASDAGPALLPIETPELPPGPGN
jgi:hypothetical protein